MTDKRCPKGRDLWVLECEYGQYGLCTECMDGEYDKELSEEAQRLLGYPECCIRGSSGKVNKE